MSAIIPTEATENTCEGEDRGNRGIDAAESSGAASAHNLVESEARSLSHVQHDVSLASQYRLELIKTVMTLSTGLLAFTVAFPVGRNIAPPLQQPWLLHLSLGALTLSICAGLFHMRMWEMLFGTYRQEDWKRRTIGAGSLARKKISTWRRLFMILQFLGFLVGVCSVGAFAELNIRY